jgi:hypothetical protein
MIPEMKLKLNRANNPKIWSSLLLIGLASIASAGPRGTVPKASVSEYAAHADRNGIGVGAAMLTSDQVHKAFAAQVERCCVVVEIAFYPQKDKALEVSLDDITMLSANSDTLVRPMSARAVAATLQEKAERGRSVNTSTSVGVGYESGTYTDPVTGQPTKVHGTVTEVGVGVGVGDPDPRPGASNGSRDAAETELTERSLPEGSAAAPVSGYIFFPSSVKKTKKKGPMQVQYTMKDQTVVLNLP